MLVVGGAEDEFSCCSFHLTVLLLLLLCARSHPSSLPLRTESLLSIVSVLSGLDSGGGVGATPTAAAALASGVNPVSGDDFCCFFFFLFFDSFIFHLADASIRGDLQRGTVNARVSRLQMSFSAVYLV